MIDDQHDTTISEHHAFVASSRKRVEIVKRGKQREPAGDHCSQGLAQIERRDRIEPIERFVEYDQRLTAVRIQIALRAPCVCPSRLHHRWHMSLQRTASGPRSHEGDSSCLIRSRRSIRTNIPTAR